MSRGRNKISILNTGYVAHESEQSVLGGLLLDNNAWDLIVGDLQESDFAHQCNQLVFRAVSTLIKANQPADVVTVSNWLEKNGLLSTAGGFEYLVNVARNTPSAANIAVYAKSVRETSIIRQLVSFGEDISKLNQINGLTLQEMLYNIETKLSNITSDSTNQTGFKPIKEGLLRTVDKISQLFERNEEIIGLPSGFVDLDKKTSGFQAGDLIIVAGRPAMGKTTFSMNIAANAAIESNKPVAVFSLEMPEEQLIMRLISSLGRIPLESVRTGKIQDDHWARFDLATTMLAQSRLFIDDTPNLTVHDIRARAKRLQRQNNNELGLIVIDYLQLISMGSHSNHSLNVAEVTRQLKALAKELNIPIILLSQLNRDLEKRKDKRPLQSDLRDSGSIEQDADVVILLYRDEVYNEESPDKGTAEIIIGKQRNGPIGMVRLAFRGEINRFENFSGGSYEMATD